MANRTAKGVKTVHGTDPQQLVEKIIRERVYESRYWKEDCFGLSAELLVEKIVDLKYIGGIYAGNVKATPFLCLILKMLQLQPDKEIVVEFLKNDEYKYMRALAAIYLRLVGSSVEIYNYLEPLYCDYRKLRAMDNDGKFYLIHMDEFIDKLLREDRACDIVLPLLQSRDILEETEQLDPKKSVLDEDLLEMIKQEASSDEET